MSNNLIGPRSTRLRAVWGFPVGKALPFLCSLIVSVLANSSDLRASALPTRVQNTTLRLPDRIPVEGYGLIDAFPGLTFDQPVGLAAPTGETNRLFVVERGGRIFVITNLAQPGKALFLDVSQQIGAFSIETGLLGLAFHPGFATNRFFFVFATAYASTPGAPNRFHDVVARFEASPTNPNVALTNSCVTILAQFDDSDQHNGGDLKFGPDGYLYITMGERVFRDVNWPDQTPIDRDLQGAILRIDVDGRPGNLAPNPHPASTTNYWIPADNPYVGATQYHGRAVSPSEVRTELYATGFRNPWRITFDPVTGDLYAADVGEARHEEVNLVVRGGDYGWPYFEGNRSVGYVPPPQFSPHAPLHVYDHGWSGGTNGDCVIGGIVYQGSAIPALRGRYLFGDFRSGYVWALHSEGESAGVERLLNATLGLTAFGTDPRDGEPLITHCFDGTILRLVYVAPEQANLPATLSDAGIFSDLATLTPHPGIVPYEINVPFWSDGATKQRWFCLPNPNTTFGFNPTSHWTFPTGAVWVKHFNLQLTNGQPGSVRRLETRVLVNTAEGFYGLTYRWGDSMTNAWLVPPHGHDEQFTIRDSQGKFVREQSWRYPSRADCMNCHTRWGGRVLGFNTPQLNRAGPDGRENQIEALHAAGYFDGPLAATNGMPALAMADDASAPVEFRVRSYFQANCVACHVPGGPALADWDARFTTPMAETRIVSDGGIVKPGSAVESRLYARLLGWIRLMPPIGTSVHNTNALNLLANWITNMAPAPWSYGTIGDAIHFGGSTVSNGVCHVGSAGPGFQGTNDHFQFMHQRFDQPAAQFIARLVSQSSLSSNSVAGIMLRDGTGSSARFAMAGVRGDGTALSLRRTTLDSVPAEELSNRVTLPQWLRLVRLGNDVTAFRSSDGINWTGLGTISGAVSDSMHVGFAVASGTRTDFNNAMFDNVSRLAVALTSPSPPEVQQPANVILQATVEHSGRSLARVEYYDGTTKVGESASSPYTLTLTNVASGLRQFRARAVDALGTFVSSEPFTVNVISLSSAAAIVSEDRTTRGTWRRLYGTNGYVIVGHKTNLPPAIQVSAGGAPSRVWAVETEDPRALAKVSGDSRIAAAWKPASTFTVSVRINGGSLYRLALYFLDWDTVNQRVQSVELIDPGTGDVLSSQTVSNFSGGVYLLGTVRGSIDVRLRAVAGPGPVLSGVFFDSEGHSRPAVTLLSPGPGSTFTLPSNVVIEAAVSTNGVIDRAEFYLDGVQVGLVRQRPYSITLTNVAPGTHTAVARACDEFGNYGESSPVVFQVVLPRTRATFLREDTTTRGNWLQRYGTEGFLLAPLTNWWPTMFPYHVSGHPWLQFGDSPDFPQLPDGSGQAFPFMFGYSTVKYDVKLADGRPRAVALYFFDDAVYNQTVSVFDAVTGQVFDSRTVTNGYEGRYLVWNAQGHVLLCVSNPVAQAQARVCALFLDPLTNTPPEVRLVEPTGPLTVNTPAKILLAASAESADGLRRVEFHTETAKLGETQTPPYEYLWAFPAAGVHQVFARAVSVSGAVSDSQEVPVIVQFATKARVRFIGADAATGGEWKGHYGTEGYWLPSALNYSNLPPAVSIVTTESWAEFNADEHPRALKRPDSVARIFSLWSGPELNFRTRLNDGRPHRVSLYNYSGSWTNPIVVTMRDAESGKVLDIRDIPSQLPGTYLSWEIEGAVDLQITPEPWMPCFVNAIFTDIVPDNYLDWQKRYFTPRQALNALVSGFAADPDADGYDNWSEFLLGRDPQNDEPQGPLWLERQSTGVLLHALVAKNTADNAVTVESATTLENWGAASELDLVEIRASGQQDERVYRLIPLPESNRMLFFRLRFAPPGE